MVAHHDERRERMHRCSIAWRTPRAYASWPRRARSPLSLDGSSIHNPRVSYSWGGSGASSSTNSSSFAFAFASLR